MQSPEQIKRSLVRAMNTVRTRPSIGQRTYTSHATITNGLECQVTEKDHYFAVDVPKSMGGNDTAASPAAYLRAAMSSCIAMGIKMWAARMDVPMTRVDVWFEMDVDARGQLGACAGVAPGFDRLRLAIDAASTSPQNAVEEVIETSLEHSPLMDVFRPHGTIETHVTITQAEAA